MKRLKALQHFFLPFLSKGVQMNMQTAWTAEVDKRGRVTSYEIQYKFYRIDTLLTHVYNTLVKPIFYFRLKVYLPAFQGTGFRYTPNGYMFAIAFDSATTGGSGSISSLNLSHTIAATDPILLGSQMGQGGTTTTTMTWNTTEALTKAVASGTSGGAPNSEIWYRAAPTSSTHTLVIVFDGAGAHCGQATSLTGALQSSPIGTTNSATTSANSISVTVATGTANSMVFDTLGIDSGGATQSPNVTGTNQTERSDFSNGSNNQGATSTMTTTSTGNYVPAWSWVSSKACSLCAVEVKPLAASGPANLKSLDTNLKANIKSYNTNPIANIKSIDTNV